MLLRSELLNLITWPTVLTMWTKPSFGVDVKVLILARNSTLIDLKPVPFFEVQHDMCKLVKRH